MNGAPRTPLAGIRVLEIGNYMAGPFCGTQLADLGAEVVKVELGEDSLAVLSELGYTPAKIDTLMARRAAGPAQPVSG